MKLFSSKFKQVLKIYSHYIDLGRRSVFRDNWLESLPESSLIIWPYPHPNPWHSKSHEDLHSFDDYQTYAVKLFVVVLQQRLYHRVQSHPLPGRGPW